MTPEEIKELASQVLAQLNYITHSQALTIIEEALEKVRDASWTDGYNSRVFEEELGYGPHEK